MIVNNTKVYYVRSLTVSVYQSQFISLSLSVSVYQSQFISLSLSVSVYHVIMQF